MEKNHLIAAIAQKTGFAPDDVRTVLRALHEVAMADEPMSTASDVLEVERFWRCFFRNVDRGRLVEGFHFRTDEKTLALRWGVCYKAYLDAHRDLFVRTGNSNVFELALLKKSEAFLVLKPSYWIGATKSSALLFDKTRIPLP